MLLIKCFPGFFLQQSSWYTTGWLPQMLYNCGMFWFKNNVKINPSAIYSKTHSLALFCTVLKYGQMKDAFPGLQCPLSQSLHLPLSWVPFYENGKYFLYALPFSFFHFSPSEAMLRSCFWIFAYFLLCILLKLFYLFFFLSLFYFPTCGQCKN